MSKLNGKTVTYAVLNKALFYPNVGNLGPTLSNKPSGVAKGLAMTVDEPFLLVDAVHTKTLKIVTIAVPLSEVRELVAE